MRRSRRAARDALAKITAVLPEPRREEVASLGLLSAKRTLLAPDGVDLARLRKAIRAERKLWIHYRDEAGNHTERRVWPIALTFFDRVRLLAAWCELRQVFAISAPTASPAWPRPRSASPAGAAR